MTDTRERGPEVRSTIEMLVELIGDVLRLGNGARTLSADTPLLGGIPEFDSMAVATVIGAIEERFDIVIDDEDLSATDFETVGTLADFVDARRGS